MDSNHLSRGLQGAQSANPPTLDSRSKPLDQQQPPSLYRSQFEQAPLNYSKSQAAASSIGDSHHRYRKRPEAFDSATESGFTTEDASFYSYHSTRDLSTFVKEVDGRMFNNQCDLYVLPSDDVEYQRLDKQHYAFVLGQGGLFPSQCLKMVQRILSLRAGEPRPAVLDLGCGSGIWTIEMAREYPECEVIGLDLAPAPVDIDTLPPNCRFEIDDANLGLSHYHGYFDLIHVRCIGSGLSDHAKMMHDVEACLKPGGIVFFIDGDMTVYQEDMVTPIPVGEEEEEGGDPDQGSWLHRIMREVRFAAVHNGTDVDGLENCIDEGLWEHELIDPSTVKVATLCTPLGTWPRVHDPSTQQYLLYIGSLIRQDFMRASRGWHPMLKKHGIPQEMLDRWSARIDEELASGKFRMCMRWRFTWGRRRSDDTDDQDILDAPSVPSVGFNFMKICHTKEEAAAVMAIRRKKFKDLPTPLVVRIHSPSA